MLDILRESEASLYTYMCSVIQFQLIRDSLLMISKSDF